MIMDTTDLTLAQQAIVNGGRDIFSIDELTLTQLALLDPYESTIVKWQNGNTLSDADFELLDTPADEL
jgi:hypothetical protein